MDSKSREHLYMCFTLAAWINYFMALYEFKSSGWIKYLLPGVALLTILPHVVEFCCSKTSVLVVQIGLSRQARSIQKRLYRIVPATDMSTLYGYHSVLEGLTSSLLRHPTYCISGCSSVDVIKLNQGKGKEKWRERFGKLSLEEREKFDIENLVNVNNVEVQRTDVPKEKKRGKEYIVLTILVAADGKRLLPPIEDRESLKKALQYLGSISCSDVKALQLLWTPQNEKDALAEDELHANYPHLKDLSA